MRFTTIDIPYLSLHVTAEIRKRNIFHCARNGKALTVGRGGD